MKRLFASLIFALPIFGTAKSIVISPTGSDQSSCGSINQPCLSVDFALDLAIGGDTLFLKQGIYTNPSYQQNNPWNGETTLRINNRKYPKSQPLVIMPFENEAVVFKGNGDFIVQIRLSENIILQGFEIEGEVDRITMDSAQKYQFLYKDLAGVIQRRVPLGKTDAEIETMSFLKLDYALRPSLYSTIGLLVQQSNGITIRNNHIHHTPGTGLRAFGSDYIVMEDNRVHDCSRRSSVGNHGLVIEGATSIDLIDTAKIIIQRNQVYDNYNEIYSWSENKTFITPHIDEGKGISLQKNNAASGWLHGRILVLNNLAWGNGFSGVHNNEGDRTDFFYNTVYLNNRSAQTGNNVGISTSGGIDIQIANNIVVAKPGQGFAISDASTNPIRLGPNLIVGDLDPDLESYRSTQIFADPLFVNAQQLDFHLSSNSPAIDQAEKLTWTEDYSRKVRSSKGDLGAFEMDQLTKILRNSSTQNWSLSQLYQSNLNWNLYDLKGNFVASKTKPNLAIPHQHYILEITPDYGDQTQNSTMYIHSN